MENGLLLNRKANPVKLVSKAQPEIDWRTYVELRDDEDVILVRKRLKREMPKVGCKFCIGRLQVLERGMKEETAENIRKTAAEVTERAAFTHPGFYHVNAAVDAERGCPYAAEEYLIARPDTNKAVLKNVKKRTSSLVLWTERKKRVEFVMKKTHFDLSKENVEKNKQAVAKWEQESGGTIGETIGYLWKELTGFWPANNAIKEINRLEALAMAAEGLDQHPWALPYLTILLADSRVHPKGNAENFYKFYYSIGGEDNDILDPVKYYRNSFEWGSEKKPAEGDLELPFKTGDGKEETLCLPKFLHRYFRNHRPYETFMRYEGGRGEPITFKVSRDFVENIFERTRRVSRSQMRLTQPSNPTAISDPS
jgi:hypothetical protein